MDYTEIKLPIIFKHSKKYNINKGHTFTLHDYLNNLAVLSIFESESDDNNSKYISTIIKKKSSTITDQKHTETFITL